MAEDDERFRTGAASYGPIGECTARDRPQGLLTYADREYLLGETEPRTAAAERKKRERIRRRIRHGIIDFGLAAQLAWDDQQMIFDDLVDDDGEITDEPLYEGLVETLEFIIRNTTVQGASFGRLLRLCLQRSLGVYYLWFEGLLVEVNVEHGVSVDTESAVALSEVNERIGSVDDVPTAALLALEEYGITSLEELRALGARIEQGGDTGPFPGRW